MRWGVRRVGRGRLKNAPNFNLSLETARVWRRGLFLSAKFK